MTAPLRAVDEILAILRGTPAELTGLVAGLSAAERVAGPAAGEWSIGVNLAHLRACQDVLGGNIRRIVLEDHPAWRRQSPRAWQRRSGYGDWAFDQALASFLSGRVELLAFLEPLSAGDWERTAIVTMSTGAQVEQSARFFGDWLARHEEVHVTALPGIIERVRAGD
jgi:hypothetical protein